MSGLKRGIAKFILATHIGFTSARPNSDYLASCLRLCVLTIDDLVKVELVGQMSFFVGDVHLDIKKEGWLEVH